MCLKTYMQLHVGVFLQEEERGVDTFSQLCSPLMVPTTLHHVKAVALAILNPELSAEKPRAVKRDVTDGRAILLLTPTSKQQTLLLACVSMCQFVRALKIAMALGTERKILFFNS